MLLDHKKFVLAPESAVKHTRTQTCCCLTPPPPTHTGRSPHTSTHTCTAVRVCCGTGPSPHTHTHTYTPPTHTHTHTYTPPRIHTHTHIHTPHAYTHAHTHTHTHTHTCISVRTCCGDGRTLWCQICALLTAARTAGTTCTHAATCPSAGQSVKRANITVFIRVRPLCDVHSKNSLHFGC